MTTPAAATVPAQAPVDPATVAPTQPAPAAAAPIPPPAPVAEEDRYVQVLLGFRCLVCDKTWDKRAGILLHLVSFPRAASGARRVSPALKVRDAEDGAPSSGSTSPQKR